MDTIAGIGRWFADLDPNFAFLLALPFAVAAAGLISGWLQTRDRRRQPDGARRAGDRVAHVR